MKTHFAEKVDGNYRNTDYALDIKSERMTPEGFVSLWNPSRPLAGNEKDERRRMGRSEALQHRFIQTSPRNLKNILVLDFDMEQADWFIKAQVEENEVIPTPNYVTINPETEHGQAGYFLNGSVSTPRALWFLEQLYVDMKEKSGSDLGMTNSSMRNPIHPYQQTDWGTSHVYSMKELFQALDFKYKNRKLVDQSKRLPDVGRHNYLFNELSQWGYQNWKLPNFYELLEIKGFELNDEFPIPLPPSHVSSTARSIDRWIKRNFSEEEFSKKQSRIAHKRWQGQGERTNREYMMMVEAGMTPQEIADSKGMNIGAAYKAIKRAKVWWEENK